MILLLGRRNSCVFFLFCKLNLVKRLLECDKYVKRTFLLPQVFIWNVCFKEACQKNKLVTEPWQRMFVWLQTHFSLACSIVTYFSRSPTTSTVLFFQDGPRWQVECIVMADKEIFSNPHIRLIWKTRGFYLNKYWHPCVCFDRETVKTRRDFHEETWVWVSQSIISQNNDFLSSNNAFRILQRIVIPIGKSPPGCSIHRLKIKKK